VRGDVVISAEHIAAVVPAGSIDPSTAREVVNAEGYVVCPGFIDIQSHSIVPFLSDGRSLSKVTQGVTTEIMGELWTPVPFGGRRRNRLGSIFGDEENLPTEAWVRFRHWLDFLEERGVSVNFGSFVGGATVREYAKGWDIGEASADELAIMERVTQEAMEDGAFGIATALIYPPNSFSSDVELTAVAKVVGECHGVYITHIRNEGDRLLESLADAITLGREANVPVEIYHLKATGERNWPKIARAIEMIDDARRDGVDVAADMYPYVGSGTGLNTLLPDWASEGGNLFENLRDPATRAKIHKEMVNPGPDDPPIESAYSTTKDHVMPIGFRRPENLQFVGKRLPEIAAQREQDWADAAMDLLLMEEQRISTIFFSMSEENLRLQLAQPWIKISTDAGGIDPAGQSSPVHPRGYGTYPRVLGKYVREERVLGLEDAIRKMTSSVAARLGLVNRGLLRKGFFADVVVFDPETVSDRASFMEPHQLSVGIRDVWVNGIRVLKAGAHTGAKPGKPVYGAGRVG
jgi:dihydroorotase/N-acyl-D-amino-acid deacylase